MKCISLQFSLDWCLLTTLKKTSNNYRKKLSKISQSISCLVEVNIYPSNVPTNQNCLNDVVTVFNVNGNQVTNSTCQNYFGNVKESFTKSWKDLCPLIETKSR